MSIDDIKGPFGAPVPKSQEKTQLLHDELNLFDATAVAVSSVAPAYSAASTLSLVLVIVGVGAYGPSVILVSFVPVMFVALSYFHLNRRNPNCGASYSWLSQVVHPAVGWYNGWVQIASSVIFCTSAPLLAGIYTLQFLHLAFNAVGPNAYGNPHDIAVVAAIYLAVVTFICIYGIRWTTNAQWVMVCIEYFAVIGFSIGGIIKVWVSHPVHSVSFHLSWFNPLHIASFGALASGLALGVFFFWGWDTALNLTEESKNSSKIPGQAGLISMWLLLAVFVLNFVAIEMLLGPTAAAAQGANVLFYFGQQFAGTWASYVMIFAVISSTVATTQTTLLPAARITYAMARDGVFPKIFGSVHEKFKTPAVGTLILAFLSLFGIMLTTLSSSSNHVFQNLVNNIGVLVAFYYGITGVACAWAFRKTLGQGLRANLAMIVAPFLGGIVLLFTCFEVIKLNGRAAIPDIIALGLGVPLVILAWASTHKKRSFFTQPLVAYTSIEDDVVVPLPAGRKFD